jgi:hypothetical protein
VPIGISNDELNIVLNAKAVWLQFSDITNTWFPLSLTTLPFSNPQAELPYLLLSPFIGPFQLSLINARIVFIIIHVLLAVVLYGIGRALFLKNEAFVVGLVAAINPWDIFFSKTTYESPLAILFYLFGLLLMLKLKGWKILLSFIPLFLGFYCYTGAKIILLPFIFIVTWYSWNALQHKKYTEQFLTLIFMCIGLFLFFLVVSFHQPVHARFSEINTPNNSRNIQLVNQLRKQSLHSPLVSIFVNKYSTYLFTSIESYLNAFSPRVLFINGDNTQYLSLFYHGWFYVIDVIFLVIGFFYLFQKYRKIFYLFLGLALIAPIPSVVSNLEVSYALRASLLFPVFIFIIGCGISYSIKTINKRSYIILLVLCYAFFVGRFLTLDILQSPIYNSEGYFFSKRVMANYIALARKNTKEPIIVGSNNPREQFIQYLFYTNNYNRDNKDTIAKKLQENIFGIGNVNFIGCSEASHSPGIFLLSSECNKPNLPSLNIAQLKDGGGVYSIYNDNFCSSYSSRTYPEVLSLSKLKIESLSPQEFCNTFITK